MKLRRSLYARPVIVRGEQCAEAQPGPRSATVELPGCGHGQNRGGSVYRQAVLVADRRRRRLPRRILGRRSEIGSVVALVGNARTPVRRPAPARAHCLASALRSSRPRSNRPGGRRPWSSRPVSSRPVSSRRVSSRPVSSPSGVQAVGWPASMVQPSGVQPSGCPSRRVSAASALSASRSAIGSVRPGAGDAGGGLG